MDGRNKYFEELFKKFFPEAFENAQKSLGEKQGEHDTHSLFDEMMGLKAKQESNIPKDENGNEKGPDEIKQTNRDDGSTEITKIWHTENGGKIVQQYVYRDHTDSGKGSEEGSSSTGSPLFGPAIPTGFFITTNMMGDDMEDDDMKDEIFRKIFGGGNNQFSFSDDPGDVSHLSVEQLQDLLDQTLEDEDYEEAAKIRDLIKKKSSSSEE